MGLIVRENIYIVFLKKDDKKIEGIEWNERRNCVKNSYKEKIILIFLLFVHGVKSPDESDITLLHL